MKSMQRLNSQEIITEYKIKDISIHTDNIEEGCGFCVTKYVKDYVDLALSKGAKFIISEEPISDLPSDISNIIVPNIREFIKEACIILYPKKPEYMVGVTGTSGKTSIVDYYRQICSFLGLKSASFGTMGIICSDKNIEKRIRDKYKNNINTPDTTTLHKILNFLANEGVDYVAFEVSSHGLHQDRIAGIKLNVAIFSNLSQDHLDYHKTMDEYKRAKLKIFTNYLAKNGIAITSDKLMEDVEVRQALKDKDLFVVSSLRGNKIEATTEIKITNITSNQTSQELEFTYKGEEYKKILNMIGSFQSTNILMALAATISCGIDVKKSIAILENIKSVSGRLERVTNISHPFHAFVDYAHKPEALESCLKELRKICKNNLLVVFGCGGDRDASKRSIMGEIASRLADIVIVTDDNPRFEDPLSIRKEILNASSGAIDGGSRPDAIKYAIDIMKEGDILLIAGKGHEDYQIIGDKKIHLDDIEEVRKYVC